MYNLDSKKQPFTRIKTGLAPDGATFVTKKNVVYIFTKVFLKTTFHTFNQNFIKNKFLFIINVTL